MIRNRGKYAARDEIERAAALAAMSIEESIAVGEALLTSELMDVAQFPDDDHPMSLVRSLEARRARAK